jgi:type 1 glutamine amidotransferase
MIFKDLLESEGVEVEQTTFEVWTDKEKMVTYDVVVSVYTMSEIEEEVSLGFR